MKDNCPIEFESNYYAQINTYHKTNDGSIIQIVNYDNSEKVYYKFIMNYNQSYFDQYIFCSTMYNINKGQIKNPFKPDRFGGFLGVNKTYRSKEYKWLYNIWALIIRKAYESPNTILDQTFANYSSFAEWYINEYNNRNHDIEYVVSNTILYNWYKNNTYGNKVYSTYYCELIPKYFDISNLDFYYRNNCISERLYKILKGE